MSESSYFKSVQDLFTETVVENKKCKKRKKLDIVQQRKKLQVTFEMAVTVLVLSVVIFVQKI